MNSVEILDRKEVLKVRCKEIVTICQTEVREMTPEEVEEFENNKQEIENLNAELTELQKRLAAYDDELPEDDEKVEEEDSTDNPEDEKINKENNSENRNFKMKKEFRLLQAISDIANNRNLSDVASAVINEGTKEMRKAGLSYGGQIQLPTSELRSAITVASEGEDVVATDLYNILEPLRAKNVLAQAGAKFLTNLVGDVQVPVMTAGNVTWEGETADAKDGAGAFSHVKLSPRRLTCYIDLSKQFLAQDSLSAEALIRQDIVNAVNAKLESTILGTEAGDATKPEGIFVNATAATEITDFAGVCNLEAQIEDANINGECKYIMSNKAKAAFRNMAKSAKSTQLVMEGGQIDGTAVYNTSHVADKNIAYGDFSQLAIGQWGGVDLTVDPYTLATKGMVRLVVNAYFDAKVLRPEAIVIAKVA